MKKKPDLWKTIDGNFVALTDVTDEHLRGIWALCRRKLRLPLNRTLSKYCFKWLQRAEAEMERRADIAAKEFYAKRKPKRNRVEDYLSNAWEKGGFDDSFFDDLL